MGSVFHGFEELINCGEYGLGVVGVGVDEAGVVFVCCGVNSESGFVGESFQLTFPGFH